MRLALTSDVHGSLRALVPPEPVDVLVCAGDIFPMWVTNQSQSVNSLKLQAQWVATKFYPFLEGLIAEKICTSVVWTWGNHDWLPSFPNLIERIPLPANCYPLVDKGVEIDGVKFWGTPWQPIFYNWAFNLPEQDLAEKWGLIPEGTDVVIVHGPPNGYGDRVGRENCGSPSLTKRLQVVEPQIVVCGHIHVGAGTYRIQGNSGQSFHVYNVSVVNEQYKVVREPQIITVEPIKET